MAINIYRACALFIALFTAQVYSLGGLAAESQKIPAITSQQVSDGIYMLSGDGGNIGVLIGDDGTFMIDDKFARLSDDIIASIKSLGGKEPDFLVNTHFHGDHAGGNENFGKAGSIIVAHHNVRARLTTKTEIAAFGMVTPPQPKAALPVVTYAKDMRLHINGHTLSITHVPTAHTDGDSIVHFVEANVIHTGDVFFNGLYPFIDVTHRGSLNGMIAAVDKIASIANAESRIIPGHGPLASLADLQDYRNMLATAEKRLGALKKRGMKAKDMIAAKPLQDMDAKWGNGMFKSDRWIELIYDGL